MSIKRLTEQILEKKLTIGNIGKVQYKFIVHLFDLWLRIQGRHNFVNLSRYGNYNEQTYRNQFSNDFDFIGFNQQLATTYLSQPILTFDPFHISKSGKCTVGVGKYYSGCRGDLEWGLEFGGIGAVDLKTKTAIHVGAFQTLDTTADKDLGMNRTAYYANHLVKHKEALQEISKIVVADSYFAKQGFIQTLQNSGYEVITRLRKDAHIRYLYTGQRTGKPGRPRQFDGQINPLNLRMDYFKLIHDSEQDGNNKTKGIRCKAYEATMNVKAWKQNVKLVVVHYLDSEGNIKRYQLLASTDIEMEGQEVKKSYNYRFQSEFVFRDGKQFTGLNHCQARSRDKLHFHINTSLTIVSLAKICHLIQKKNKNIQDKPFSMANFKTSYTNGFIFNRIIEWFGFNPNTALIKSVREKVMSIGKIAA